MIITVKKEAKKQDIDLLIQKLELQGVQVHLILGENYNVFGLVGDTSKLDEKNLLANPIITDIQRVSQPYKLANRMFHP